MSKSERDDEPVQRITNAPEPLEVDQRHRMWVYSIQMIVRIVCLFLVVLVPGPLRWLFLAGAVLLPYGAVLLANAGRDRRTTEVILLDPRQITADGSVRTGPPQAPPVDPTSGAPTTPDTPGSTDPQGTER